ncbi:MAG: hypothetical protein M1829_005851 [Trizodia sp. TS-e1964]|nr:MAG: hypothetical protein M1829_005851 [Trizodia sp. TS-e1964]
MLFSISILVTTFVFSCSAATIQCSGAGNALVYQLNGNNIRASSADGTRGKRKATTSKKNDESPTGSKQTDSIIPEYPFSWVDGEPKMLGVARVLAHIDSMAPSPAYGIFFWAMEAPPNFQGYFITPLADGSTAMFVCFQMDLTQLTTDVHKSLPVGELPSGMFFHFLAYFEEPLPPAAALSSPDQAAYSWEYRTGEWADALVRKALHDGFFLFGYTPRLRLQWDAFLAGPPNRGAS